jgi:hypothetical protein
MSSAPPVYVVTCPVPPGSSRVLRVEVAGRTAIVVAPGGFRHAFELPRDVAVEALEWRVYADILELRAPLRSGRDPIS